MDASLNASLPFGLIRRCTGTMTLSVRHVHQMHAWDCGLACAWMILRSIDDVMLNGEETYTFRNHQDSSSTAVANLGGILPPPLRTTTDALAMSHLAKLVATSSVWTIDIAHVLAKFKLPVVFTTTTIGVHPGYGGEPFYRGNMHEDAKRVERLFDDAQRVGIRVVRRSLSKHDLANAILGRGAAKGVRHILIVLCDKRALRYESTATGAPTPTQHTNAQQQNVQRQRRQLERRTVGTVLWRGDNSLLRTSARAGTCASTRSTNIRTIANVRTRRARNNANEPAQCHERHHIHHRNNDNTTASIRRRTRRRNHRIHG